jgi:hypothetical protein
MTHYAPMTVERQKRELAEQAQNPHSDVVAESLYILAASSAGDEVARHAKAVASPELQVVQRAYDSRRGEKPGDYGALVVVLEAGDEPSSVHTWLGAGEVLSSSAQ